MMCSNQELTRGIYGAKVGFKMSRVKHNNISFKLGLNIYLEIQKYIQKQVDLKRILIEQIMSRT